MLVHAWLLVAGMGALFTLAAMLTPDDGWAIVTGAAGFVAWGIAAYGSLEVEIASEGVTIGFSMPAVTLFCTIMALIPGYVALTGPTDIVRRYRNARPEDL